MTILPPLGRGEKRSMALARGGVNVRIVHETKLHGVHFFLFTEEEDIPVKGHYINSGDVAADQAAEEEIRIRLFRGDQWAWFEASVTAMIEIPAPIGLSITGEHARLSCCSFKDRYEFLMDEIVIHLMHDAYDMMRIAMFNHVIASEVPGRALRLIPPVRSREEFTNWNKEVVMKK